MSLRNDIITQLPLFFLLISCSDPPPPPDDAGTHEEVCNSLDDDGDGLIDEADSGGPLRRPCSNACGTGEEECEAGEWRYCSAPTPLAETCNGQDDDCDGQTDEDCECRHGETRQCGIDVGVCEPGVERCENGVWSECQLPYDPESLVEICNDGLDNDCDDDIDEDCTCVPGTTQPCGEDEGECQAGEMTCLEDSTWSDECVGSIGPTDDICDGLDNDCDGAVDRVEAIPFGWVSDLNEPNNSCTDAAAIYNDSGEPLLVEGAGEIHPTIGDPTDLQTYPSLYPPGDEDWYHVRTDELTDCWWVGNDCAFRLTVQLWLADRELVGWSNTDPNDYRLCVKIGDCSEGTERCSHGSEWFESANVYQLSLVWGNGCWNRENREVKIRVYSPTGTACGYYQVYAWFEYDDELACP